MTHIARSGAVDPELALRQWREYVEVLQRRGWSVIEAPPVDDCPDGVFVEDQVVVHGDVAVLCRSGAPERRAERVGVREAVESQGYRVTEIEEPGTLDGGDVLKHGRTIWVGIGGRSNASGIEQLRTALAGHRVEVLPVPVTKVLHLEVGRHRSARRQHHRLSTPRRRPDRVGPVPRCARGIRAPMSCCSAATRC